MTEQPGQTRANLLAQMASHPSVTTDVLAGTERQFKSSRLSGDPPIAYLEESEAPAYVLTNQKKGIGLGTKRRTTTPDNGRGTITLVTGRRTLCLVGQDSSDEVVSVPHESVASVSAHTGLLANRLELRTPQKAYHCWVERTAPDSLLESVATFIDERKSEDPVEVDRDDGASRVTYRGNAVAPETDTDDSGASRSLE